MGRQARWVVAVRDPQLEWRGELVPRDIGKPLVISDKRMFNTGQPTAAVNTKDNTYGTDVFARRLR